MRVQMSYHIFNTLAGLLNGDIAAKIGRGIISIDPIDREYKCSLPSKVNVECAYENESQTNLIYEVKFSVCEAIYR